MGTFSKCIFFFLLLGFISCKKKTPEDIGLPLLPSGDLLNAQFTDTATLIAHTVKDDSLNTTNLSTVLLGNMNDPVFSITKASLLSQFSLSATSPDFGTNPQLDSAVLSLVYVVSGTAIQHYGNLTAQKFDVYELSQTLSSNTDYYSNVSVQNYFYSTQIIGSAVIAPAVNADSVSVDTLKFPAHLRIKLSKGMFQHFLDDPSYTSAYNSNTNFQTAFKGIYLLSSTLPASNQGAILYLSPSDNFSRLTLYYHNDSADSLYYYFGMKSECARFSHFEHDYSGTTDIQQQLNSSASVQEDKVFVQPMAGVRAKISMPYIMDFFRNKKVAVNKAELILPVEPSLIDTVYPTVSKLVATIADSAKGPIIMPDYFEGATYFGGDYDATNKVYKFNIARYIQQVLNGTRKNQGLYLLANARPTTANRIVLLGGNKALANKMRLKITYTPLQ
ncbi:MAG: DUF4270 domain-containing protein [Bacteroidetes bacterium]|nr:DUF4270 domain-containing protein [Bacteroidota bacterium]